MLPQPLINLTGKTLTLTYLIKHGKMKLLNDGIQNNNGNNALQTQPTSLPSTQEQINEIRGKYPSFLDFCNKFTPQNAAVGAQHPTKCVTCSSPTLTYLNLAYGDGNAIAWLILHLTYFQEQMNIPNKMSAPQLETCAQTIYDNFHHLKTTEIMLFLARLLGGMYPVDWHGYITPTKIVSALRDYFMPWRNDLLYKIDKQEKQRKLEESLQEPGITWEEYCKLKGIDRPNPLTQINSEQ